MKTQTKILFLTMALMALSATTQADEVGNGGSGMYIGGQYKTFGELGVELLRPGKSGDIFSAELQKEILDILNKTPLSNHKMNLILESIFGNQVTYRIVKVVDPKKF